MGKHVFRFYDVLPGSCFFGLFVFLVDIRSSSSFVWAVNMKVLFFFVLGFLPMSFLRFS